MMRGVIVPAVSIGHSFILVTLTSAMGCVCSDMVFRAAGSTARCLLWWCVVVDALSSVDESVSESAAGSVLRFGSVRFFDP
jgi:hypothetical protein